MKLNLESIRSKQDASDDVILFPDETRRKPSILERKTANIYRRAFGELNLYKAIDFPLKQDYSYHFLTNGNIDSLSYIKFIMNHYELDYMLFSTWCMSTEDVLQIAEWLEEKKIKKMDAYLGEIFPGRYSSEYKLLMKIIPESGGRVVTFRNHSKIFAGYGDRFYFGLESSANITTNPRCENACLTISKEIFDFYYDYFQGIKG